MISTQTVSEIKSRISIKSIVEAKVYLSKSGKHFRGLCPFHTESTPSFFVMDTEGRYLCYGCGAKGDVIDFLQATEGLTWIESVRNLASQAGIELDEHIDKAATEAAELANKLYEINELACQYFESNLDDTAMHYLEGRGINENSIRNFRLGYSGSTRALDSYIQYRGGYTSEERELSGLFSTTAVGSFCDFFHNRIMFPIFNRQGKIVSFGGRAINDSIQPKYLNGRTTPIYDKSSNLYGIDKAKSACRTEGKAIVTEGFLDVVTAHQNGFTNVVAVLGTSLTQMQVELLKKFTNTIVVALDGDTAGSSATMRSIETITGYNSSMVIKAISLPSGEDVDSLIKKSPTSFAVLSDSPKSVIDFYIDYLGKELDLTQAHDKTLAFERIAPLVLKVNSPIERETYIQNLALALSIPDSTIRSELGSFSSRASGTSRPKLQLLKPEAQPTTSSLEHLEDIMMANLINYYPQSLLTEASDGSTIKQSDFSLQENIRLYEVIRELLDNGEVIDEIHSEVKDDVILKHYDKLKSFVEGQPLSTDADSSIRFLLDKMRKNGYSKIYNELLTVLQELPSEGEETNLVLTNLNSLSKLLKVYGKKEEKRIGVIGH